MAETANRRAARVAVISDVHGNAVALEAVHRDKLVLY